MREVAVVGFAQSPYTQQTSGTSNGVEMLVPILRQVLDQTALSKQDIGFWCSGSSDYLAGRAFSFVSAVDAIGAYPPINESHVEMDAAWALYEAWIKILIGEVDTALIYGFGKPSAGDLNRVLALQLDPYVLAPLWPDPVSIAAMQARQGIEAGLWTEKDMAVVSGGALEQPYVVEPLRQHDIAPFADGAAVVVLAAADRARDLCQRPAWIVGIEHRIDAQLRHLTESPSTAAAGRAVGTAGVEIAELHTPFSHQEIILRRALELDEDVNVNGSLHGNPMFAAGLARIGTAASHVWQGHATRVLAHATSGPALQQNLVCVLEAR